MDNAANHGAAGFGHDDYFSRINELLKTEGPGHPVMVVDLDVLDRNLDAVVSHLPDGCAYRVVAKSLPSIPLIRHVFDRAKTHRAMVFHRPYLNLIARELPETEVLMGKPFPVSAVRRFYEELDSGAAFDPSRQLQWLVDTEHRLLQYRALAREIGVRMRINVEIDVGFHRGGLTDPAMLAALLDAMAEDPEHLLFSGFMGYDPHVAHAGKVKMSVKKAHARAVARYRAFVDFLKAKYPAQFRDELTFNGAGSPTYQLYENEPILNDICVGSALVKPSDFDLATLADHAPAMFIATPVLKKLPGVTIPFLECFSPLFRKFNRSRGVTIFIYGGYWKADPVSPPGLIYNSLFGRSSNQEMLNGPADLKIEVDDYVFLRPFQSEFVMLHFGDLVILREGGIADRWPVFRQ
jgi:D-serine deaminase-like pyridoxal phosphate-dependent protein